MYKKTLLSLTFFNIIASLLFFTLIQLNSADSSIYGQVLGDKWEGLFLFHSKQPFKSFPLPLIFSFYTHLSLKHLLVNLTLYSIASGILEKQYGFLKTIFVILFIHTFTLMSLSLGNLFLENNIDRAYSGSSAVVLGLLAFLFIKKKARLAFGLTLLVLYWQTTKGVSFLITDPHMLSYIIGSALALFLFRRKKATSLKA